MGRGVAGMSAPVTWYALALRCPNCGAPPAYRITRADRDVCHHHEPTTILRSFTCQVGWCRTRYVIRAADVMDATPEQVRSA